MSKAPITKQWMILEDPGGRWVTATRDSDGINIVHFKWDHTRSSGGVQHIHSWIVQFYASKSWIMSSDVAYEMHPSIARNYDNSTSTVTIDDLLKLARQMVPEFKLPKLAHKTRLIQISMRDLDGVRQEYTVYSTAARLTSAEIIDLGIGAIGAYDKHKRPMVACAKRGKIKVTCANTNKDIQPDEQITLIDQLVFWLTVEKFELLSGPES